MELAVDLHIHSALSPCADNEMTPNNIINMALLKGLDIIAVTDHNSVENYPALFKCAENKDILVVPGMELETREEIHLLCLFQGLEAALGIQRQVYGSLPPIPNRVDIFGSQLIMDENDDVKCSVEQLLVTATQLSIEEVFQMVKEAGGAVIPAHVDRSSYSIISNLGIIPEHLEIKYLELSRGITAEEYTKQNPGLDAYKFIRSSDAHSLGDILERKSFVNIKEKSIECLINTLKL